MKSLKIKNILLCAFAATTLLSSCSDFLDKLPENKVDEEKVDYTNLNNMYQPVSGVYAKLRQRGSHWIVWGATVVRDDDVSTGRIDDQADLVAIDQSYNYNAGFWGTNEAWMVYYDIIKVANAALEALDNYAVNIVPEADGKRYEEYTGEVKFIRAYCYYRLTELFGPVTILRDNKQTDMTRSTVNAVYRYMLSDLEYSMTYLPRIRPNEYTDRIGAVSAFTAEMLAAKVYMEQGNWSEVERLTDDIIGSKKFSLYSDFNNLFKIPGKLCDESLFEMQFTDFGNGSGEVVVSDSWFTFQGPLNDGNISGWGFISPTKAFRQWAAERGETIRATTTFLMAGETTQEGDFIKAPASDVAPDCFNGKAYTPSNQMTEGRTEYGTNNNIRVFRYAEVLLMNAEAKVRQNKDGDISFNLVRKRAGMPELEDVTLDQIMDERRMELALEWGERYNDLRRTGKLSEVLGPLGWTSGKEYYPVPTAQIDISSTLENEPKDE